MIVQAPEMQEKVNQRPEQKGFHIKAKHKLFDHIKEFYKINSDADLANILNLSAPELSRYRVGHKRVNAKVILAVYDATKMPIEKIRELLK
jgi:hypothetical protein